MDPANTIQALILDFGEVLVRPQSAASIQAMAELAKLDTEEFRRRYWHHRPAYDSGRLSGTAYWQQVIAGGTASEGKVIEQLKTADAASWVDYREDMWELAAEFRRRPGRTGFLSNGVPEVMQRVRSEKSLTDFFDAVVLSYEVGCTKPDPRIYEVCLSALGVPAESALFVDDRQENLDAAGRLGMQVLHFTGDSSVAELRSRLAQVV